MNKAEMTNATAEWNKSWKMVLAASIGFSFSAVVTYSFGLFIEPLGDEFGWSRSEVSSGLSLAALLSVPLAPLLGIMIDRWGSRRLAISGTILTGICMAAFSFASGSLVQWLTLWAVYAVLSVGINSTVWAAAISGVFSAGRGMALGLTLSGAALAQVFAPALTQWLIETVGWRYAFVALGLGWGSISLVFCVPFLFDAHDDRRRSVVDGKPVYRVPLAGLSLREAARSIPLYRIGAATLIMMILTIGILVHQVPILTEAGVSRQGAAYLAGLTGIASIVGKLVTGYFLDRMDAGIVGSLTMGLCALSFVLLLIPFRHLTIIILSMVILGYSNGCKFQICAFQTARYAGLFNFGKIFGVMSCLVALGAGLGPFIAGVIYDFFGSYEALLAVGIPASLLSGLLLYRLGPYPDWNLRVAQEIVQASDGSSDHELDGRGPAALES